MTPAFAAATDAGMTLLPLGGGGAQRGERRLRPRPRRGPARQASRRATCSASTAGSTTRMPPSAATSGEGSASVKRLTPTTVVAPASMRASRAVLAVTSSDFM